MLVVFQVVGKNAKGKDQFKASKLLALDMFKSWDLMSSTLLDFWQCKDGSTVWILAESGARLHPSEVLQVVQSRFDLLPDQSNLTIDCDITVPSSSQPSTHTASGAAGSQDGSGKSVDQLSGAMSAATAALRDFMSVAVPVKQLLDGDVMFDAAAGGQIPARLPNHPVYVFKAFKQWGAHLQRSILFPVARLIILAHANGVALVFSDRDIAEKLQA
jgi:hypothetical protein